MTRCGAALAAAVVLLASGAGHDAAAQAYPTRPVTLIAPFAPGGPSDVLTRALADGLSKRLGQPVIVQNRAGGGGTIGVGAAAQAAPDGHTLVLGGNGSVVFAEGVQSLSYNVRKDLRPVALVAEAPSVVAVATSLGVNTLDELVERAKRPPRLSFASAGVGGTQHLAGVMLQRLTKTSMAHVPYRGLVQALTEVQSGTPPLAISNVTALGPFLESGKVKAIAVLDDKRSPQIPQVPTAAEAGLPGLKMITWYGVLAPAGVSDAIVARLNEAITAVMKAPETMSLLDTQGFTPAVETSVAAFTKTLDEDFATWLPIIKELNLKPQ
jgi:tripartite-type tricarboxylate transporter receptor subunit TctC